MMKRYLCAFLILCVILVFGASFRTAGYAPQLTLDTYGRYTGFSVVPEQYTPEQAAADGCMVLYELDEIANTSLWSQFLQDCAAGRDASVRIAQFYEEFASLTDVIYLHGRYHAFYSDAESTDDASFMYMLTLDGQLTGAERPSWVVVLTDDPGLTFDDVMNSFLSSTWQNGEIAAFRWVRLGVGEAPG